MFHVSGKLWINFHSSCAFLPRLSIFSSALYFSDWLWKREGKAFVWKEKKHRKGKLENRCILRVCLCRYIARVSETRERAKNSMGKINKLKIKLDFCFVSLLLICHMLRGRKGKFPFDVFATFLSLLSNFCAQSMSFVQLASEHCVKDNTKWELFALLNLWW